MHLAVRRSRPSILVAAVLALAALVATLAAPRPARASGDASTTDIVLAGSAMAIPTYFLGVAWHEGTHALSAHSFGAEVTELHLLPGMYDGRFYFGYTRWKGGMSQGETAFTLVAPKFTDMVLFGGYTLVVALDGLPSNDYLALALTVLATGAWVDFTKDVVSWNPGNDLNKVHAMYGHSEWQKLPYRFLQAGLSIAGGYVLYEGYSKVFATQAQPGAAAVILPLVALPF